MMNELLWLAMLLANFLAILVVYRAFGRLGLFIWMPIAAITANIQVLKTIEIFGITATLGNIVYASSFLVTDIFSELYDKKNARLAVMAGFVAIIAVTGLTNLALVFDPAPSDFVQESLEVVFGFLPRVAFASLAAYVISQFHDVWAYGLLRRLLPDRRLLWVRNNASTMVSQLIDSLVFTTLAFWGVFEMPVFLEILLTTYVLKFVVAAADTPFLYVARRWREAGRVPEPLT
jgi:hypothetical protein